MMSRKHDVIILGSGLAGLRAALEATQSPEVDVALISKAQLMRCNSVGAAGGTAAVMEPEGGIASSCMPGIRSKALIFPLIKMS